MYELQQLHRELNIAQSTGTEFELTIDFTGGNVFLDPPAHRLDIGNEVIAIGR